MLITTKDENGAQVQFDADEHRVNELRHFFTSNPSILGFGVGGKYNRSSARDAFEAQAFAVSQLAYVEQKTYERQYAPLMFEKLLGQTVDYSGGEWATSIEYQIVDYVGVGKRINAAGTDIPEVDVAYARKNYPVAQGAVKYSYNTEDLRISSFLQRPLPVSKLRAANTAYMRHINNVALLGESASNYTGLFNNANVTPLSSAALWSGSTADQIFTDVLNSVAAIQSATQNNSTPSFMAVPITQYQYLLRPRSTVSDTSVLQFIQQTYPGMTVMPVFELGTAGTTVHGVNTRVVFFNPDDENMIIHIPMALRFAAPQFIDLKINVPGEYKYAGLEIRRPLTVGYLDGT